jgi:hypothetical protein
MLNLITLKAVRAMREEDVRVARKHLGVAAALPWSVENAEAYAGAARWLDTCVVAMQEARGAVIRALAADATLLLEQATL